MFFLFQSYVGSISLAIFDAAARTALASSSLLDFVVVRESSESVRRCDAGSADDVR
jgi:hypothetical protein